MKRKYDNMRPISSIADGIRYKNVTITKCILILHLMQSRDVFYDSNETS